MNVGIGRADDDPPRRVEKLEAVEPEAHRPQKEEEGGQDEQVRTRPRRQPRPPGGEHEAALEHVQHEGQEQGGRDQGHAPAIDETPERQGEDEEPQVVSEEGIDAPEWLRVQIGEKGFPVGGGAQARTKRDERDHHGQKAPDERFDHHSPRQAELVLQLPQDIGRRGPHGEGQVGVQKDQHAHGHCQKERALQGEGRS